MGLFGSFTYMCVPVKEYISGLEIKASKCPVQKCVQSHKQHYTTKNGVPL